jgi:hypothetical protein
MGKRSEPVVMTANAGSLCLLTGILFFRKKDAPGRRWCKDRERASRLGAHRPLSIPR